MSQFYQKSIYYIAFPIFVLGACWAAYYLGMARGKQLAKQNFLQDTEVLTEVKRDLGKLQFYEKLKNNDSLYEDSKGSTLKKRMLNPVEHRGPAKPLEKVKSLETAKKEEETQGESDSKISEKKTRIENVSKQSSGEASNSDLNRVVIQISAFRDVGKAHEYVDELRNKGFRGYVISDEGEGAWHRVFVGPFASKDIARARQTQLEKDGLKRGFIVEKYQ